MSNADRKKVTVLGDGGWGTALAMVLDEAGNEVTLWSAFPDYADHLDRERLNPKFLPGITIPEGIRITHDLAEAAEAAIIFSVVPSQYLRDVMTRLKEVHRPGCPVASATKGIETDTLDRATQIIGGVLGSVETAVVSGPSHAEEVARRMPTTVVVASVNKDLGLLVQSLLNTERFRVYTNSDPTGAELGGCIKNVLSIAGGMVDGLGFGDNTKAALLSRGIVEMGRLGEAMGGQRSTFFGLAGIGDLIVSCTSRLGRNRAVGEKLGQGYTLQQILDEMEMVAEGVKTTIAVTSLMERHGVEMPICREIQNVLYEGKKPVEAVNDLMTRTLKDEVEW